MCARCNGPIGIGLWLAGLLLSWGTALATPSVPTLNDFDSSAQYQRYQTLAQQFRCVVCANQSILDSQAPVALSMRQTVAQAVQSDAVTDQALIAQMQKTYGGAVLFRPRHHTQTWVLWWGPGLIMIGALLWGGVWLKRQAD